MEQNLDDSYKYIRMYVWYMKNLLEGVKFAVFFWALLLGMQP